MFFKSLRIPEASLVPTFLQLNSAAEGRYGSAPLQSESLCCQPEFKLTYENEKIRGRAPQSQRAELKSCFKRRRSDQKAALFESLSQQGAATSLQSGLSRV